MLTFILLVVLGGGVGLLVVSLAESGKPATVAGAKRRGDSPVSGSEPEAETVDEAETEPVDEPEPVAAEPGPALLEPPPAPLVLAPEPPVDAGPEPVSPGAGPAAVVLAPPRQRRLRPQDVPRAFTAVEGRFADVARVPLWRRALAVVGILAITVAGGVLVAVVLAAAFGTIAEVLDKTIG